MTVRFSFTTGGCDISQQCRQSFDVYKWQTSTIDSVAARNTSNYDRVARVSSQITGFDLSTESLDISLDAESGFYLAIVDLGNCITINRILVFYYVCPAEISQLIVRPEAIPAISMNNVVNGECVENSSPQRGSNSILSCSDEGQWHIIIPCHCNPGYELADGQEQCLGIILCIRTCI